MQLFDAHNHIHLSPKENGGGLEALSAILGCASSATKESDWDSLRILAQTNPDKVVPGFGIHPWWADSITQGWEERLEDAIDANSRAFIGEAGLDAYRANRPNGLPLEAQNQVLMPQLEIAASKNRPIVLHCVKAWHLLLPLLQQFQVHHFAIHRFKGTAKQASEIIQLGGYLSIHSDSIQHTETAKCLHNIPIDRILIESDYDGTKPDATTLLYELDYLIQKLSNTFGKEPELLAQITADNARKFYRIT